MYSIDTNTNTAIERQADRVRAVNAYGTGKNAAHAAAEWGAEAQGAPSALRGKLTLALAAVAPVVLIAAWGLLAH